MNGHLLTKMTDVFHWIHSTIIKGEGGLVKSPKEARPLYASCERGPSNLILCFVHGIISKALMGWALILTLMAIFLFARKSFTGWSSRSSPVRGIICLLGRQLGIRWGAPSPCTMQLLLQLINLTLHVSFILCMGDMALPSWLTLASMCCMRTSFMISPLLRVYDWIVMLRALRFYLVRINIILVWANRRLVWTWLFYLQR